VETLQVKERISILETRLEELAEIDRNEEIV
jgi:hypothetical protein